MRKINRALSTCLVAVLAAACGNAAPLSTTGGERTVTNTAGYCVANATGEGNGLVVRTTGTTEGGGPNLRAEPRTGGDVLAVAKHYVDLTVLDSGRCVDGVLSGSRRSDGIDCSDYSYDLPQENGGYAGNRWVKVAVNNDQALDYKPCASADRPVLVAWVAADLTYYASGTCDTGRLVGFVRSTPVTALERFDGDASDPEAFVRGGRQDRTAGRGLSDLTHGTPVEISATAMSAAKVNNYPIWGDGHRRSRNCASDEFTCSENTWAEVSKATGRSVSGEQSAWIGAFYVIAPTCMGDGRFDQFMRHAGDDALADFRANQDVLLVIAE